jgi:DNA topoisomerase-1
MAQWGFAVRTDEVCEKHGLNFVRLVRKGARPWDIGCPLCHHINSNQESLAEIPGMTAELSDKLRACHIYTVAEITRSTPEPLAKKLGMDAGKAEQLIKGAGTVLEKLRRRSECRKFIRDHLIPRKGRSYAKIMASLKESGVTELVDLAKADPSALVKAGISEAEAGQVVNEAKIVFNSQVLKEIGIPAVSLKKYVAAGIIEPETFCSQPALALSEQTGMSLATVQRHVGLVCTHLKRPVPKKFSKLQIERGRKELLAISGLGAKVVETMLNAGVIDAGALLGADPSRLAKETGISEQKIRDYQKLIQKKKDNAIIQL